MGFRETINENRRIVTGATIGLIVLVLGIIIWEMLPSREGAEPTKAFYSDDDGHTWFKDSVDKIPPFDHSGHVAVLAHVYHWSGGDFVGYLEKYPDKVKDKLVAATSEDARVAVLIEYPNAGLVKKPGSPYWVRLGSADGNKIVDVQHPPNGNSEVVTPLEP